MPRVPRMKPECEAVFHLVSRTALEGLPFGDVEKDYLVELLRQLNRLCFAEQLGCVMISGYCRIFVRVRAGDTYTDEDIKKRFIRFFGTDREFLDDFGLKEFGKLSDKERFRRYREYLYEAGALGSPGKEHAKKIDEAVVKKERKRKYRLSRTDRFRYRTRYFTDSGIIGSREFVSVNYQRFRNCFSK